MEQKILEAVNRLKTDQIDTLSHVLGIEKSKSKIVNHFVENPQDLYIIL